jgi:hypothetical protein
MKKSEAETLKNQIIALKGENESLKEQITKGTDTLALYIKEYLKNNLTINVSCSHGGLGVYIFIDGCTICSDYSEF